MVTDVVRDTDLQIRKGDLIIVLDTSRKDRWKGTMKYKQGFFPPWVVGQGPRHTEGQTSVSDPGKRCRRHSKEQTVRLPESSGAGEQSSLSDTSQTVTEM